MSGLPCPGSWTPHWCCPLPNPDEYPDVDVEQLIAQAITAAAEVLYHFSGQQFGLCEATLRPCRSDCWGGTWPGGNTWWEWGSGGFATDGMYPKPALIGGLWFNLVCGGCPGGCACTPLSEALLPQPVEGIVEVKVDGLPLIPGVDYRLDNGRRLVRLGGASWPLCQHLELDDSQPGTWSVTALFGTPLPVSGQLALGELACQFIQACLPGGSCQLGPPVQQLVRQGVTMNFLDPNQVFANGRIGLPRCDLFISWANPNRLTAPPQVYDVDGSVGNWRWT